MIRFKTNHNGLQNFVANGGQNTVIVVDTECRVHLRQRLDPRPIQQTECDINCLKVYRKVKFLANEHTFTGGDDGDISRVAANIIDNRLLDPRNVEMSALASYVGKDTTESVEDDSAVATLHYEGELQLFHDTRKFINFTVSRLKNKHNTRIPLYKTVLTTAPPAARAMPKYPSLLKKAAIMVASKPRNATS